MRDKFYTSEELDGFLEMRAEQIMDLCPAKDDGSEGICAIVIGKVRGHPGLDIYFANSDSITKFDETLKHLSSYCLLKKALACIPVNKRLFLEIEDRLFPAIPKPALSPHIMMNLGK